MSPTWFRRRDNPINRPWKQAEYVVVDLETTGLDLKRDTIASYGAVTIRDGRMIVAEDVYGLVCTTCEMTPASVTVHALRPADVADAPPLSDAVGTLDRLLAGRVLVAHAAWIERAFLSRAFADHGAPFTSPVVDTAAMARAAGRAPSNYDREPDLEDLADNLGLPVVCPHHALGDAITTAYVFLALASRLAKRGYETVGDLIDLTAGERGLSRRRR